MKLRVSILTIMICSLLQAQDRVGYKILVPDNNFQSFGLHMGLGLSITGADIESSSYVLPASSTTDYQVDLVPQGKVGLGGEIGGLFALRGGPFRFIEFGAGYRQIAGQETARAARVPGGDRSFPEALVFNGKFKYHRAALRLSAQSLMPIGKNSFIHLGPGLKIEETLVLKEDYTVQHVDYNREIAPKPDAVLLDMTFGIGLGIGQGRFLDFYVNSALLNFSADKITDTREHIYNSTFKNTYCGVRLIIMKGTPDRVCPAMSSNRNGGRLPKKRLRSDFYPW